MVFEILVYKSFNGKKPDHKFMAKNGREVVGLMKTIMDNFQPVHVDIINQEKFKENEKQIQECFSCGRKHCEGCSNKKNRPSLKEFEEHDEN